MKTLIICKSVSHGSTQKIAETLKDFLNGELTIPEDIAMESFDKYELIGFGSGIYRGKHHISIFDFLNHIPYQKSKKAFVFSTSGSGMSLQHKALINRLKEKGFDVIGDFACPGINDYGPLGIFKMLKIKVRVHRPNKSDIENAKNFSKNLQGL